jgi:uncharacterized damage-inducible protein DinB
MNLLDRLLGHDHWATMMVLERSRSLTDDQLDQPIDAGRGSLRETLDHLIYVVGFWVALMNRESIPPKHGRPLSIPELSEHFERNHAAFAALVRRIHDEGRTEEIFPDHHGDLCTLGITILQVPLHNARHRADAQHMLTRLGVADVRDWDPQEWEWAEAKGDA